jgi:hypothetical protein
MSGLQLSGDENAPALPLKDSEINHLRRLLAWMRCEWMPDKDMQLGYMIGAFESVRHGGSTPEQAASLLQQKAEEINRCPSYVRQAVEILTKALHEHERASGIIDAQPSPDNQRGE